MMVLWSLIFILWKVHESDCSCTFPESGTWETSDHGIITFTSTTVRGFPSSFFGAQNYTCVTNVGDRFMARSPPFVLHGVDFEIYLCLRLVYVTANKYLYYLATDKNANAGNERLKSAASSAPLGYSQSCDRSVFEAGSYSVMIRTGSIQSELENCPNEILARWNYNISETNGNRICTDSTLDTCQNNALNFNPTQCSRNILHTADGIVYCLYSTQIRASSYYITTYSTDVTRPDDNTTFRFSCLVMEANSNESISVSHHPRHCNPSQTATSVHSPGSLLALSFQTNNTTLNTSTESPPLATQKSTETSQADVAVAVVVPLILLIVIAAILGFIIWRWYKRKLNAKPLPDPKYIHGEIRNRRLNVQFEGDPPHYSNTTSNGFIKLSENDISSAMIQHAEILNSSMSGPSSLSSLLVSVQNTQLDPGDNCNVKKEFVNEISDNDDVISEFSSRKDDHDSMDLSFHSIGVDTSDLQNNRRRKGLRTTPRRRFRLRRSRSSVGDSLLASQRTKDNSAQKSVVTFGTKNVVLGIQPPKVKKKRHVKRDIGQPLKLKNISEKVERKREKTAIYQQKGKARKLQQNPETPERKYREQLDPVKTPTEDDRFPIISFSHYQEEGQK